MKTRIVLRSLGASLLLLVTAAHTVVCAPAGGASPELRALLQRADSLFSARQYRDALALLDSGDKQQPANAELLWRLSSHLISAGDAAPEGEKDAYYQRSIKAAERAVTANAANANAHAWLAAALGSHAMFAGGKEKVQLATRIRDELDRALALDPNNQTAHSVYGTWHRGVADVSWVERQLASVFLGKLPDGSFDESVRHLREAIRIGPGVLRHRYELGLTYLAMDRPDLAVTAWKEGMKCPLYWSTDARRKEEMRTFITTHPVGG